MEDEKKKKWTLEANSRKSLGTESRSLAIKNQ